MVPARVSIKKTLAGMDTSDAPLSIVKFSVILSFMTTGTTNVPRSRMSGIDSACAAPHARRNINAKALPIRVIHVPAKTYCNRVSTSRRLSAAAAPRSECRERRSRSEQARRPAVLQRARLPRIQTSRGRHVKIRISGFHRAEVSVRVSRATRRPKAFPPYVPSSRARPAPPHAGVLQSGARCGSARGQAAPAAVPYAPIPLEAGHLPSTDG